MMKQTKEMWKHSASWKRRSWRGSCRKLFPVLQRLVLSLPHRLRKRTKRWGLDCQHPTPGKGDENNMDVETERKRIRGCIEAKEDPGGSKESSRSVERGTVEAFFQPLAKLKPPTPPSLAWKVWVANLKIPWERGCQPRQHAPEPSLARAALGKNGQKVSFGSCACLSVRWSAVLLLAQEVRLAVPTAAL
eukprot:1502410-Amphidinium_carterae.1